MTPQRDPQAPERSTAPSQSTARPEQRSFLWALHWVFPEPRVLALGEGQFKVGRDPGSACALDDNQVSREHALLHVEGHSCRVVDLQSRNGTSLDGEQVRESVASDGSVLRVGGNVGVLVHSPDACVGFGALDQAGVGYRGSGKLKRLVEQASQLGALRDPVYVQGESGSGKEAIAELVHRASERSGRFVALNCSSLKGELARAALFGHVKGAFSGAVGDSEGAARAAQRGTLYLDEIGDLPRDAQPLLLRLLQNAELTPVGASRPERVDLRVVSASHEDLFSLCREQRFREDLYFRLATHELRLPALRERREDILGLFCYFAQRSNRSLSAGFVEALLRQPFPGNVRELCNLAARLKASAGSEAVWHAHLLGSLTPTPAPGRASASDRVSPVFARAVERDWVALHREHGGVAARIAKATGVPVSTVKRYLKQHGLRG